MWDLIVGLAAGALTSTGFVPQIIRGLRTRSLTDVSPIMLAVMVVGLSLWLLYGILKDDMLIVAWNVVAVSCSATLLALWLKWGRPPRSAPVV